MTSGWMWMRRRAKRVVESREGSRREKGRGGGGAFLGVNLISGRYFRVLTFGNEPLNLEEERQTGKCALFQIAFSPRCNHPSRGSCNGCLCAGVFPTKSLSLSLSRSSFLTMKLFLSRDTNCIVILPILRNA